MIDIKSPLQGEMNGYKFSVKPKSLLARKIDKELQKELRQWQEENNKEFVDFMEEHGDALAKRDFDNLPDDIPESHEWLEDVDFRAERFKKMADHSMEFKKQPPATLWKSEELEYGVIELAWSFFTGKRQMPMDMLTR